MKTSLSDKVLANKSKIILPKYLTPQEILGMFNFVCRQRGHTFTYDIKERGNIMPSVYKTYEMNGTLHYGPKRVASDSILFLCASVSHAVKREDVEVDALSNKFNLIDFRATYNSSNRREIERRISVVQDIGLLANIYLGNITVPKLSGK